MLYRSEANPLHPTSIKLQTRAGNDIVNSQIWEIDTNDVIRTEANFKKYVGIQERTGVTNVYNCHGLTFASRRTGIDADKELAKILREDKYDEVDRNNVMPGDVIIYYDKFDSFVHSGIVVENHHGPMFSVSVVSKWGGHKEFIHNYVQCPYDSSAIKFYRINQ